MKPTGERIMPEGVAASLRDALKLAVTDQGTGPLAQVDGLQVAGKTGTSQAITSDGGHSETEYVTSFAGYFPADHPQVVAVVVVDGASVPVESNYGGLIAAPIFAAIAKQTASYLHLTPSVAEFTAQNSSQ
jgi:cell division protein FtsI/penicillin-binding protein 2